VSRSPGEDISPRKRRILEERKRASPAIAVMKARLIAELVEASAGAGDRLRHAARVAAAIRRYGGYRWVGIYDVTASEIVVAGWDGPSPPTHPRFVRSEGLCGSPRARPSSWPMSRPTRGI
jgi:putative methionine-R-sulfoxide reductase with GAF domain